MINFNLKPIFGMVHLTGFSVKNKIDIALEEIDILYNEGIQGCIIENYHGSTIDVVNVLKSIKYEKYNNFKFGVNILPNEYDLSVNFANYYQLDFIQLDYVSGKYEGSQEIDENVYNKVYQNSKALIFGGVWPKYYKPIEGSILETDIDIACKRANAIVVTGNGTGQETPIEKIKKFKDLINNRKPLIIGAGLNCSNLNQLQFADGAIVGSCFKRNGDTLNQIDSKLVKKFISEKMKGF